MKPVLEHHGIKGQRWGIRRYQNPNGTLTRAGKKRLAKELKREYKRSKDQKQRQPSDSYDEKVRESLNRFITDRDKESVANAYKEYRSKYEEAEEPRRILDEMAKKYAREYYDDDVRRDPDRYNISRIGEAIEDTVYYEFGIARARAERPNLAKVVDDVREYGHLYDKECRRVCDKLLGEYGNMKVYELTAKSSPHRDWVELVDTVDHMVGKMSRNDWQKINNPHRF